MNKNLTGLLSGLTYALASFLVSHGLRGGITGVYLCGIALSGVIAGLVTRGHASRRASRGKAAEPMASIIAGWSAALVADLIAFAAFAVLIVVALAGMRGGF